jgi:cation diffusion facilitator CzcD-associated flavoprotein CzcO
VGAFDRPKFGTTPGRENFTAASWHTAHWNHEYNLKGKNVAVIKCVPSVAQVIPEIIDNIEHFDYLNAKSNRVRAPQRFSIFQVSKPW